MIYSRIHAAVNLAAPRRKRVQCVRIDIAYPTVAFGLRVLECVRVMGDLMTVLVCKHNLFASLLPLATTKVAIEEIDVTLGGFFTPASFASFSEVGLEKRLPSNGLFTASILDGLAHFIPFPSTLQQQHNLFTKTYISIN